MSEPTRTPDAARMWRWLGFYAWKVWNRTRYYWSQAQSRKRAIASLRAGYAEHGMTYAPRKPWWLP